MFARLLGKIFCVLAEKYYLCPKMWPYEFVVKHIVFQEFTAKYFTFQKVAIYLALNLP